MPRDLAEFVLNVWHGPSGLIVSAINEPEGALKVPDLNAKLGCASREFGEAIDASLKLPTNSASLSKLGWCWLNGMTLCERPNMRWSTWNTCLQSAAD
ncbi:hypothetical protein PCI56_13685 [Plesiomonas shigelloides subsp. oncorhynchi]|nr:hypothetical protein [Plesiomonas shigelloides]MDA1380573.1 hypothetical protein [Plesiomonas shigelloides]MDA1380621.1 hypothetical protein [Plesiomonas shigelloides]